MKNGVRVWYHALKSVCIMILYLKKVAYAPVLKTVSQVSGFNEIKKATWKWTLIINFSHGLLQWKLQGLFYDHFILISTGCVPASSVIQCPLGSLWRDAVSCVRIADCTCRSHSGKPVKVCLWMMMALFLFFWDVVQHRLVVGYQHFGMTYWHHLQGSEVLGFLWPLEVQHLLHNSLSH